VVVIALQYPFSTSSLARGIAGGGCVRYRGRRARLLKLQGSEPRAERPEKPGDEKQSGEKQS
jgi:hypothetical protein